MKKDLILLLCLLLLQSERVMCWRKVRCCVAREHIEVLAVSRLVYTTLFLCPSQHFVCAWLVWIFVYMSRTFRRCDGTDDAADKAP